VKRNLVIFAVLTAVVLVASACAPQAAPTAVPATQPAAALSSATQAPAAVLPSGPAMVNLTSGALAAHLVDDKGMTLYLFTKDSPGTSTCYDKCATAWPPLLTSGAPQAGSGVDASKFGTTMRTDGSTQVTYNGWPLYYFAKDKQAGDTTGEGVGSVWFCISASGDAVKQQ
jgi:predicted lipoprotein with Yx(FWY)xxD motif